ncbi:FMN-dependent NADH-azoreductase [Bacillus mangrovi]|uniref:FMN dependent NADH:quinone oxidoreductase n=1 Tax=Metabacillus mangrovi TaxID=1491830 RepID=A0A7X2S4H4_9BACI|nr:FMN-dependent NADH-azoreductase [Metabacillus mangrovi]MTH53479.1 FMN-dependent NADH-azoreductase [Metabacillus mangrovi]
MGTVLYVKANPKGDEMSFSARVANTFMDTYQSEHPEDQVEMLDLYNTNLPLIDSEVLGGWGKLASGNELTESEQAKITRLSQLVDQFLKADKVVFSAPMWNFGFPPLMKAYIDAIAVAGKTFKYTENGPVGLAGDKKVVLIEARGGIYSEGPAASMEHTESYFRAVMGFMGIEDVEVVLAEGMAADPAAADQIFGKSVENAKEAALSF